MSAARHWTPPPAGPERGSRARSVPPGVVEQVAAEPGYRLEPDHASGAHGAEQLARESGEGVRALPRPAQHPGRSRYEGGIGVVFFAMHGYRSEPGG